MASFEEKKSDNLENENQSLQIPENFQCPLTLEMFEEPFMCPKCSQNFEGYAIRTELENNQSCPWCRAPLAPGGIVFNRAFKTEIQAWLDRAYLNVDEESLLARQNPYCAVFIGKMGVGKSLAINKIVGRPVAKSKQSPQSVTQMPSVAFNGVLCQKNICLVDAPGLFDSKKSNSETLEQITEMLHQNIFGLDCVFHVLKMGRMEDDDLKMPVLILDGLAGEDTRERSKLSKRYKIIVTHCDSFCAAEGPEDDAPEGGAGAFQTIEEFRGYLKGVFPRELGSAVENAIFVEFNLRLQSSYNDMAIFQREVLRMMVRSRELKTVSYRPPLLAELTSAIEEKMRAKLDPFFAGIEGLSQGDLFAILSFFRHVAETKKWQPCRETDPLPRGFVNAWMNMNSAVRDTIGVRLATDSINAVNQRIERLKQIEEETLARRMTAWDFRCIVQ